MLEKYFSSPLSHSFFRLSLSFSLTLSLRHFFQNKRIWPESDRKQSKRWRYQSFFSSLYQFSWPQTVNGKILTSILVIGKSIKVRPLSLSLSLSLPLLSLSPLFLPLALFSHFFSLSLFSHHRLPDHSLTNCSNCITRKLSPPPWIRSHASRGC